MSGNANFGETTAQLFSNAIKEQKKRQRLEGDDGLNPNDFKTLRELEEAKMTAKQIKKKRQEEAERVIFELLSAT